MTGKVMETLNLKKEAKLKIPFFAILTKSFIFGKSLFELEKLTLLKFFGSTCMPLASTR